MVNVLIICGPTATGKTKLAVDVARRFGGELINADSRQMYAGFDAVSGKDIPPGTHPVGRGTVDVNGTPVRLVTYDLGGVDIWLYDALTVEQEAGASVFRGAAVHAIHRIAARGKLPIVVGGTGFYIASLTDPAETIDIPPDRRFRDRMGARSLAELAARLRKEDPDRWEAMNASDRANSRRLLRALEVTRWKKSHALPPSPGRQFDTLIIGLRPVDLPDGGIARRVRERFDRGVQEVRDTLSNELSPHAASIIGIPVIRKFLSGTLSRADAEKEWTRAELQYAGRQMTWFAKRQGIRWFDAGNDDTYRKVVNEVAGWYTT